MYFFNFTDFQIIGASPEILVRLRDNKITVRPIAGTRPRGKDVKEDNFLAKDLLNDNSITTKLLTTSYMGKVNTPCFKLNNYIVWGATAMMLSEIKQLFNSSF